MRQGLLSEPKASSGPAAMLLAVSRSPSSIPRRSPCPERCHLSLASLNHIHLSKSQKASPTASTPGAMPPSSSVPLYIRLTKSQQHPPRTNATFLWRPSIHPPHESTSPSRTRSVRLSPPLRYQSSTKESKELTGILPIMIWINAFFSSKRKV